MFDKSKDSTFNGMVFVQFDTVGSRNKGIDVFNAAKKQFADNVSFMSKDRNFNPRVIFSFLLNFKRLLITWGFKAVSFDEGSGVLSIGSSQLSARQLSNPS